MENNRNDKTTGVLLTNLGTPDAPTTEALRRYLAEFLWDRRVVDLPRPLWWFILHGIILRTRPARSARAYRGVWTADGSPLLVTARQQQRLLQERLDQAAPGRYRVLLGMRYGNPSIAAALTQFAEGEIEELRVLPLYPQNSCSTTASTFDAIAAAMQKTRALPPMRFIADYHDHPLYIAALAASVREQWSQRKPGQLLLFSFHGTPRRFRDEGDPYYRQCLRSAELTAAELGLEPDRWRVSFQSRFGREEWLQPYTDLTLQELPKEGITRIDVICPGFSADCLETIEEIGEENRQRYIDAGGVEFNYIDALNARDDHIALMSSLIVGQ